jgi:bacteriorhodopsin
VLLTLASSQLPSALQVCHDLTRPDGPPLTQPDLQRLPGRERDVDLFLREVARRLSGRQHCQPETAQQSEVWAAAAAYLSSRLHVDASEVAQTAGFEQRKPDMSPAAGAAFLAVLAEVGRAGVPKWEARLEARLSSSSTDAPTPRRRERRSSKDPRRWSEPSASSAAALVQQLSTTGDVQIDVRDRRPSRGQDLADSLERWRIDKLGLTPSAPPSERGSFVQHKSAVSVKDCTSDTIVHIVAWTTFALFTLGAIVLLVLWSTMPAARTEAFVGTFFVCAIASLCYYAKATHMGDVHLNGTSVPMARYIDWLTTTPLLMYELCHLAHTDFQTTMMLVGCDILMISAGIYSACLDRAKHTKQMAFWFAASCVFYVIMLCIINVRIADAVAEQSDEVQELFSRLQALTSVVWTFYPIVVLLGRAQCYLISQNTEDVALCVLDLVSKLGVEGLIVAYAGFIFDSSSSGSASDR